MVSLDSLKDRMTELNDSDLENVSGGTIPSWFPIDEEGKYYCTALCIQCGVYGEKDITDFRNNRIYLRCRNCGHEWY